MNKDFTLKQAYELFLMAMEISSVDEITEEMMIGVNIYHEHVVIGNEGFSMN